MDVRRAVRSLIRRPALSLLAILTLGVGIGANTAMFSIINAVLLKPLPFRAPEQLVMVWSTAPSQQLRDGFASYPDFRDWKDQARSFDGLAAFWTFSNGDVNLRSLDLPDASRGPEERAGQVPQVQHEPGQEVQVRPPSSGSDRRQTGEVVG